jgi:hypothetical protein
MDCVTSRSDVGKSLDPVYKFRVENNVCAISTSFAGLLHKLLQYTLYVYKVSLRLMTGQRKGALISSMLRLSAFQAFEQRSFAIDSSFGKRARPFSLRVSFPLVPKPSQAIPNQVHE